MISSVFLFSKIIFDVLIEALPVGSNIVYQDTPPKNLNEVLLDNKTSKIIFENKKTEEMMKELVEKNPNKKFAVLNFANAAGPGGYQEHSFNNTTVFQQMYDEGLSEKVRGAYYEGIPEHGCIYTKDVSFKGNDKVKFDVISAAAPNRNQGAYSADEKADMKHRIQTVLAAARVNKIRVLVLGAWGCGQFNNPPEEVAALFKEVIEENDNNKYFQQIIFAIPGDMNDEKGNYKIFKDKLAPAQ